MPGGTAGAMVYEETGDHCRVMVGTRSRDGRAMSGIRSRRVRPVTISRTGVMFPFPSAERPASAMGPSRGRQSNAMAGNGLYTIAPAVPGRSVLARRWARGNGLAQLAIEREASLHATVSPVVIGSDERCVSRNRSPEAHDARTRAASLAICCAMRSRAGSNMSRDFCGMPASWNAALKRVRSACHWA